MQVRTLPCLHTFHAECVEEWLKKKKVCPLCQFSIDPSDAEAGAGAAEGGAEGAAATTDGGEDGDAKGAGEDKMATD